LAQRCGGRAILGDDLAVATEAGLKRALNDSRWVFPRFDDQSSLRHPEGFAQTKISRRTRTTIAAIVGAVMVGLGASAAGIVLKSLGSSEVVRDQAVAEEPQLGGGSRAQALVIHVSGAVVRSGLVELSEGARVHDAIQASGGVTTEANVGALNLARLVVDGEHLVVPAKGEVPDSFASSSGLVSLSLASASELESLSGVGPALAQRIISWREEHGPFRQVEDVLAVSGIGPATLEGFRDQVVP
jgi:competence protein ComEA